jgi:hypothetical protein
MESVSAVRAGVSDPAHLILKSGKADLRRRTRERVSPSFLPRAVHRIGIGPIDAVAVLRALQHCALLDQCAKRPAAQRAVCGKSGLKRKFELRLGGHSSVPNQLTTEI